MKKISFTFYALLVAVFIIAYKKNSFVFWGLLVIIFVVVYKSIKYIRSSIKGTYFLNKGDAKKAINNYSELIASSKSNKGLGFANRGIVYLRTKKYNSALYDFVESAKTPINPLLNIAQIGIIYCEFKEYDRALKYFLRVIELKPKSSIAYNNLGWFYWHTKEYDKAIKSLNKSMTLKEFRDNSAILANTYSNLGFIYIKLKEYDKADEFLSKALKLNLKSSANFVKAGIYRKYAYLQRILENISLSKKYALKAIELNPYEDIAYKILAEISLTQDDYDGFYTNFETFLDKKGRSIDNEDVEDEIYEKVKGEEKFELLIKKVASNITVNDLNISIDDYEILHYSGNKKQKTNRITRAFISILLLIMIIISLSVGTKQSHKTTIFTKISSIDRIYKSFNIDKSKIIKNSPKYKVSFSTTNVRAFSTIKFQVSGLKQTAKINSTKVFTIEDYNNTLAGSSAVSDLIGIDGFKTINNQIKTYVFIEPFDENKIYEYDFILTEIK